MFIIILIGLQTLLPLIRKNKKKYFSFLVNFLMKIFNNLNLNRNKAILN